MVASAKEDIKSIQADVSSFLTGLGFSPAGGDDGSGFNDVDFRKTGRIRPDNDGKPQSKNQKPGASEKKVRKEKSPSKTDNQDVPAENLEKEKKKKKKDKSKEKKKSKEKLSEADNESFPVEKFELKKKDKKNKIFSEAEENSPYKFPKNKFYNGKKARDEEKREDVEFSHSGNKKKPNKNELALNGNSAEEESTLEYEKDSSSKADSKIFSKIRSLLKSSPWFEALESLLESMRNNEKRDQKSVGGEEWNELVNKAQRKGEEFMEKAAIEYEKLRGKDSDMRWLMIARKTGTTADKVAALTVLLQDDPIANLKSLDSLLGMVTSKGGKRHAAMGIDALKEIFTASLLPDRKLKYLTQQNLDQAQISTHEGERLLFLWYWEDCLKHRYEKFVEALDEAAKDKLPFLKEKAVKTIYELLRSKPEQERRLLCALVNKLGDPERKIASNAGYYLSCLLSAHPNMKMVVIEEVDSFLFRPRMSLRSRYQAAVFLNLIVLSNRGDGPKLAKRLIDIYLSLFKVITASQLKRSEDKNIKKKKGHNEEEDEADAVEIDSRLLSALLTGVNRAFPYVGADDVDVLVEEHTPILFRLVHSKSFNVGLQALMLLYQLLAKNNIVSGRLYRALYAVLLSPSLPKSTKLEMFLSLVFKAVKSDISSKRMAAFSKRLMQVALQGAPQFACGCLLLLSEVLKSRPSLWHAVTQPEDGDEEVEHFKDVVEDEMVQDGDEMVQDGDEMVKDGDEMVKDGDETNFFQDICEDATAPKVSTDTSPHKIEAVKEGQYNMRHRDPSFCNADQACWWELTVLASHAHPSVAAMAKTLLSGASILYNGDPLRDLALGVFLDRFTEKKPKSRRKSETWHGSSLSTPTRKASTQSNILPVGAEFLELTEGEVAPEDIAFHKFYTAKVNRKGNTKKEFKMKEDMAPNNDDNDLMGDESDDDEIEDLLEQEEGEEMGLDDVTDDENDSEGEWIFEEDGAASENNMDGEDNSSGEDTAFGNMDENEDDIPSDDIESDELRSSKRASKKVSKKKRKQESLPTLKGQRKKNNDGSKKSPFASFEEYSHMLDTDDASIVPRLKKSKRAK